MESSKDSSVTELLARWKAGDESAESRIFSAVYGQLKQIAKSKLTHQYGITLTPTDLTNEAYLRLRSRLAPFSDSNHLMAAAASIMRSAFVDHMRARNAAKRGGDAVKISIEAITDRELPAVTETAWLEFEDFLTVLTESNETLVQIIELRVFAGLSHQESADVLGLSEATVRRRWHFARALIRTELFNDT